MWRASSLTLMLVLMLTSCSLSQAAEYGKFSGKQCVPIIYNEQLCRGALVEDQQNADAVG
jgi:hypothetical protein